MKKKIKSIKIKRGYKLFNVYYVIMAYTGLAGTFMAKHKTEAIKKARHKMINKLKFEPTYYAEEMI